MVFNAHAVIVSLQVFSIGFFPMWSNYRGKILSQSLQEENGANSTVSDWQITWFPCHRQQPIKQLTKNPNKPCTFQCVVLLASTHHTALEQELEDLRTSDPCSKPDFIHVLSSFAGSLMTCTGHIWHQLQSLTFTLIKTFWHETWRCFICTRHHPTGVFLREEVEWGGSRSRSSKTSNVQPLFFSVQHYYH